MKKLMLISASALLVLSCKDFKMPKQEKTASREQQIIDFMKLAMEKQRVIDSMQQVKEEPSKEVVVVNNKETVIQTQATPQKKKMSGAVKGALIGAGVGAVTGAVVSEKKGQGALIGGVAGAAVGAGTGAVLDDRKKN